MSAIEEIKQKIDIAEVIGQYTKLKKAGRNLTALCPFHSEKHPSFFVYPEQQTWHCFGTCNTGGDVFAFLMKKEGIDFAEALQRLASRAGVTLPARARDEKREKHEELYRVNEAAAVYFHNLLLNSRAAEKARLYLEKRGLSVKSITDFQIGFSLDSWDALKTYLVEKGYEEKAALEAGLLSAGEARRTYDRFRGKLMFPIKDTRGRVTGFGARVLDDSLPKYINSPQTPLFDKSATLYGIDLAAGEIRKLDRAIIMEGYMDVIAAHQNGITNAVASLGTAITEAQVNILKKLTHHLFLALDADAAGEEAMTRTIGHENTLNAEIRVVLMPPGQDPDDVIRQDIERWRGMVENAVPLIDFVFQKYTAGLDLTSAAGKSQAAARLMPVIAGINDPIRQAHYLQKLAGLVRVDLATMRSALGRLKQTAPRPAAPGRKTLTPPPIQHHLRDAREEYLLAMMLKHPELKKRGGDLSAYLENSENREIYAACQHTDDPAAIAESLHPAIREHFEEIINRYRHLPAGANDIERKYEDCIVELEKRYLRRLEARRAEILALEAASHGTGADLARLEQEGIEISARIRELETLKSSRRKPTTMPIRR